MLHTKFQKIRYNSLCTDYFLTDFRVMDFHFFLQLLSIEMHPLQTLYFAVLWYKYLAWVTCGPTLKRWLIVAERANEIWDR